MQKILDEKAKRFKKFLEIISLFKRKDLLINDTQNEETLKCLGSFVSQYLKAPEKNLDGSYLDDKRLNQIESELTEIINGLTAGKEEFCQFLFGQDLFYLDYGVGSNLAYKREYIINILKDLQIFMENYYLLPKLMTFVNVQNSFDISKYNLQIPSMEWVEQAFVIFTLKNDGELSVSIDQNNLLYGYRDFSRILRCNWKNCESYFLANRKDAKLCSNRCRESVKQFKYLQKDENKQKYLRKRREKYSINKQKKEEI